MKNLLFYSHHRIRTVLLMCVVLTSTFMNGQNKEVRLAMTIQNATLDNFVKQLENATGFSFVYGEEVKLTRRISMKVEQQTISEILQHAFKHEAIRFKISDKYILLHQQPLPQKPVSRKFTISGYVTDGASSETLIGANILDSRHATGTITNPFGFYTLTLPEGETSLTFSYLGYETLHSSFELNKDTLLNIRLNSNTQLEEVVVLSHKREAGIQSTAMGAHEIPMAQIRHTPSILGEADLLKTVQLMPGVQAGMEGFSGIYVRGGGADQNLILLDGTPVYNADHLMGLFSIFTPEAVKKVTLFKSSFPARYGGRLSSIVDVRTNDGDMNRYHGTLSIGTLTDKIHLEGPIIKNRTAFNLSARTTHTLFMGSLFKDKSSNSSESFNYFFYDVNAKVNHKFSDRSRLFLGFYKGADQYHFDIDEDNSSYYTQTPDNYRSYLYHSKNRMNWGNTVASARWNYVFTSKLFSNTSVAFNQYRMSLKGSAKDQQLVNGQEHSLYQYNSEYRSGIRDWSFRTDFDYTPSPRHHIKFGAEYLHHTFRPETTTSKIRERQNGITQTDTLYANNANGSLQGHEVSLYAEDNLELGTRFSLNAGIRLSLFHTQGKSYLSAQPRLSARYHLNNGFSIKAAYSRMTQYVHLLSSTPLSMPTDLWVPITKNVRPMYSHQYSIGGYYEGIPGWEFSVEGYYKQMRNVLEYQDGTSFFGTSTNWEDKIEAGKGRSFGMEIMVQKTIGRTTGWIAYTLSKSERRFQDGTISNGNWFPYKYDRRHSISLCINHKFSDRIDVGASWIFYTGGAITVPERQTVIVTPDGSIEEVPHYSARNNYRLPVSHRLNLGINFHKKTKHGVRTWNISLYNAYNAMNPNLVYTETRDGRNILKKLTLLPCFPSVTYTYRF